MLKRHQNVFYFIKSNCDVSTRILDIGCDKGHLLNELLSEGYGNLDYLDIKDSIEYPAVKNLGKLKLADLNIDKLPYEDGSLDIVCALQVLEHLENPHHFKRECERVLKPGGKLIISMPHGHNLASKIRFFLRGNVCRWEKGGDHITFLTKNIFLKIFLKDFNLFAETYSQGNLTDYKLSILLPDYPLLNKLFGRNVYYILEKGVIEHCTGKKLRSVCYFGCYDPDYARHRVLIGGLRKNGCAVVECRTKYKNWKKYFDLWKKFSENCRSCDVTIVAHPGHSLVWFARIISKKPIIFDPIYSYYDSFVFDRMLCEEKALKAKYYHFLDWFSSRVADCVILECGTLIDYFVEEFKLPREKFVRVIMSADDEMFKPAEKEPSDKFIVHFHGTFIPFQGIEYIIKAAKILENEKDLIFNLIGAGQTSKRMEKLIEELGVKNINYWGRRVPSVEILKNVKKADICLGFFTEGPRAQKVMTNKIFESIAMKKSVITADLPVMREIYSNNENIIFCEGENSRDLAEKILLLKNNRELRERIALNAYNLFKERLNPAVATKNLIEFVEHNLCLE